jgi:hypothetical protein
MDANMGCRGMFLPLLSTPVVHQSQQAAVGAAPGTWAPTCDRLQQPGLSLCPQLAG